jgi:hypothetical protein
MAAEHWVLQNCFRGAEGFKLHPGQTGVPGLCCGVDQCLGVAGQPVSDAPDALAAGHRHHNYTCFLRDECSNSRR